MKWDHWRCFGSKLWLYQSRISSLFYFLSPQKFTSQFTFPLLPQSRHHRHPNHHLHPTQFLGFVLSPKFHRFGFVECLLAFFLILSALENLSMKIFLLSFLELLHSLAVLWNTSFLLNYRQDFHDFSNPFWHLWAEMSFRTLHHFQTRNLYHHQNPSFGLQKIKQWLELNRKRSTPEE